MDFSFWARTDNESKVNNEEQDQAGHFQNGSDVFEACKPHVREREQQGGTDDEDRDCILNC